MTKRLKENHKIIVAIEDFIGEDDEAQERYIKLLRYLSSILGEFDLSSSKFVDSVRKATEDLRGI